VKMKEIMEQTGLTDRAVRLYIANGLVTPADEKSYDGRSKIEFSEADAERLKKIALLRKADFSLAQIKSIISGGEEAQSALREYIAEKSETQESIAAALNALGGIEDASLETICTRLENGFEEKSMPEEDMKPSKAEKRETLVFKILCTLGILPTLALMAFGFIMNLREYRFFSIDMTWEAFGVALFAFAPAILFMIIGGLYAKPRFDEAKRKKRRVFCTVTLIIAMITLVGLFPLQVMTFGFTPNISSHTDDPANYLELDGYVKDYLDEIYEVFPTTMPQEARNNTETTRYSYSYQYCIDPWFNIYAEWQLNGSAYEAEKADNIEKGTKTAQMGEWVYVFVNENGECPAYGECIIIFAYNDSTSTVRYICTYATNYETDTYDYSDLNW